MSTAKLIAFVTSMSCLWSLIVIGILYLIVKRMERKELKDRKEPPFVQMQDQDKLDNLLSFYKKLPS